MSREVELQESSLGAALTVRDDGAGRGLEAVDDVTLLEYSCPDGMSLNCKARAT